MKLTLRLLAPYIAVGVFWCWLPNAWLAILAYHAQILFWSRKRLRDIRRPPLTRGALMALPAALAGPLLYLLFPCITHTDPSQWLVDHHLAGLAFLLMIPYFGLLHPLMEQLHWAPLREQTPVAHLAFAGYHVLVLYSLLTLPWLVFCSAILLGASVVWRFMAKRAGGPIFVAVSHILADLGIIVAAGLSIWWGP